MKQAAAFVLRFRRGDDGATAVEYALICALIAVVVVGGATSLGTVLGAMFQGVATTYAAAVGP